MAHPDDNSVSFLLVDVFADRPLHGNPVAVVPDAGALTEDAMQRVAREFNQSETTFIMPATRAGADWRLRSFTPAGLEAFGAGHNTLGAWWALAESGVLALNQSVAQFTQEVGSNLLMVRITCERGRQLPSACRNRRLISEASAAICRSSRNRSDCRCRISPPIGSRRKWCRRVRRTCSFRFAESRRRRPCASRRSASRHALAKAQRRGLLCVDLRDGPIGRGGVYAFLQPDARNRRGRGHRYGGRASRLPARGASAGS